MMITAAGHGPQPRLGMWAPGGHSFQGPRVMRLSQHSADTEESPDLMYMFECKMLCTVCAPRRWIKAQGGRGRLLLQHGREAWCCTVGAIVKHVAPPGHRSTGCWQHWQ